MSEPAGGSGGLPPDEQTLQNMSRRLDDVEADIQDLRANRLDPLDANIAQANARIDGLDARVGAAETSLNGIGQAARRADNWIRQTGAPFVQNFNARQSSGNVDLTQPTTQRQNATRSANSNNASRADAQEGISMSENLKTAAIVLAIVVGAIFAYKWLTSDKPLLAHILPTSEVRVTNPSSPPASPPPSSGGVQAAALGGGAAPQAGGSGFTPGPGKGVYYESGTVGVGPTPPGHQLVKGKPGDSGCFRKPGGGPKDLRCPNSWAAN
ncbi:hypothetical protein C4568_00345 [Candidatus Parcubacteria bacterium]|nr:MAG: hypothetical protein C4568_00345 [Candidatus Parcubacteria bacterium]